MEIEFQKFEFIGFQYFDTEKKCIALFNNEEKYTVTLPKILLKKEYITNFEKYNCEKKSLIETGFIILENNREIDSKRIYIYIKNIKF